MVGIAPTLEFPDALRGAQQLLARREELRRLPPANAGVHDVFALLAYSQQTLTE